jgi:hypothetical protein
MSNSCINNATEIKILAQNMQKMNEKLSTISGKNSGPITL